LDTVQELASICDSRSSVGNPTLHIPTTLH
jgi:hypothetical protein